MAERHEAGMRDISLGRHVSKPKVRFSEPAPSAETSALVIRAQTVNKGREPATYTVSQMTDILQLMYLTNGSPTAPEAGERQIPSSREALAEPRRVTWPIQPGRR